MSSSDLLWVVIPAFNEAKYISACLEGFATQTDHHFRLVLVDNASTDDTTKIAQQAAGRLGLTLDIIKETHKGTGWACRAGFDHAIKQGAAIIARIDADCAPHSGWVEEMQRRFGEGYEFIGGALRPFRSESWGAKLRFALAFLIIRLVIYKRRLKQGKRVSRFMLSPGANLAITAKLYEAIGGFGKTSIETHDEDLDLSDRAVQATSRVIETRQAIVYTSTRRINALGLRGTLNWYGKKTEQADIR